MTNWLRPEEKLTCKLIKENEHTAWFEEKEEIIYIDKKTGARITSWKEKGIWERELEALRNPLGS